jgi:hypothetical protein
MTRITGQLESELSSAKISEKRWQLQQRIRIELSCRIDSCNRELRESPELAVGRINEKKWQEMN